MTSILSVYDAPLDTRCALSARTVIVLLCSCCCFYIETRNSRPQKWSHQPNAHDSTLLLTVHCESLQPEIASILLKLGLDRLQTLHRSSHKETQAKKIEDDTEFIPRSARVNFTLSSSNLAAQDAEHMRLADETSDIVTTFQAALKKQIISVAKLEVQALKQKIATDFANSLRLAVEASLICEPPALNLDAHQVVNTLIREYDTKMLAYLDVDADAFREGYKRVHTLVDLPAPLLLTIPDNPVQNRQFTLPSQDKLLAIQKIHRTIETTFLTPWSIYLDVQSRNAISLQLKTLGEKHFTPAATEAAAMEIDAEEAVEPQLLKNLIQAQVTAATRSLETKLKTLRTQLSSRQPKNFPRGHSRASKPKKKGNQAAAANSDSAATRQNKQNQKRNRRNHRNPGKALQNDEREHPAASPQDLNRFLWLRRRSGQDTKT